MRHMFVMLIATIHGSLAFAEADLNPNIFNRPVTPAATSSGASATREGSGTGGGSPAMSNMPGSINPGSNSGQQSQKGGSGANAAAGAALMAQGAAMMSQPPTMAQGAIMMAMGILAMMQSGEDSGAAGQSAATGAASVTNGSGAGSSAVAAKDSKGTSEFVNAKIKEGQAKLTEAGYKMTEKGLTAPDGSFIPSSSFNSPSSMSAAGIPSSTITEAQKILAGVDGGALDGGKVSSVGLNTGGVGGGMAEGDSNGSSNAGGDPLGNPFNINSDMKNQLVAGKTVMFDGEPIGVRGQNIFDMVHACYQKKLNGKHFIEGEQGVATRMPASVKPSKK